MLYVVVCFQLKIKYKGTQYEWLDRLPNKKCLIIIIKDKLIVSTFWKQIGTNLSKNQPYEFKEYHKYNLNI